MWKYLSIISLLFIQTSLLAQNGSPITQGERFSLYSNILDEERSYYIHLPRSYDDDTIAQKNYPVMYILDGETYFHPMSGMVQFMSSGINGNYQIPEFIVIAVPNTNRIRDLTPSVLTDLPPGPLPPNLSETGGGDEFLRFLDKELFPAIESSYRTMPYRMLVGHSLGGLMGLYALISQEHMFNSYIIADPSLWWEKQMLLSLAKDYFPARADLNSSVYISSARRLPDGLAPPMVEVAEEFYSILQDSASSTKINSRWDYMEQEDHGSIPLISLYNGLNYVFSGYKPFFREILDDPQGMVRAYEELSARLGASFFPPESVLIQIGLMALGQLQEPHKAIEILKIATAIYPSSHTALNLLGTTYMDDNQIDLAIIEFEKSLEQKPGNVEAISQLEKLGR